MYLRVYSCACLHHLHSFPQMHINCCLVWDCALILILVTTLFSLSPVIRSIICKTTHLWNRFFFYLYSRPHKLCNKNAAFLTQDSPIFRPEKHMDISLYIYVFHNGMYQPKFLWILYLGPVIAIATPQQQKLGRTKH